MFRVATTPLAAPVPPLPVPAGGGVSPALLEAFVPAAGTEEALAALADPGTLVVTTGQQPALFTGPLYTVAKALSAVALARRLEATWGRRVVPVFWSAGDDHDFAEAATAAWLDRDGRLRRVTLRERAADAPMRPLWREPVGAEVLPLLDRLRRDLPDGEPGRRAHAWLAAHFRPEATLAAAGAGAVAELLAPFGMLVLDATHPAVKRLAWPWLERSLLQGGPLESALASRAAALRAQGADPGIQVGEGLTLVMLEGTAGRDRLVRDGTAFVARRSGERHDLVGLRRLADAEPERFSANVLLRPALERALLPTVAYVAGPGELRYLPLAEPVYEALGLTRQRPVPRWSGAVLDAPADRYLDKFGLTLAEVQSRPGAVEARAVADLMPAPAVAALERLREQVALEYEGLQAVAPAIDPTLAGFLARLEHRALADLDWAERKLRQRLRRRHETELGQLRRVLDLLAPEGQPQERVLTAATFLGRWGPGVLDAMLEACTRWYAGALEAAPAHA